MYFLSLFFLLSRWHLLQAVARFEPTSVTDTSLVIKMIKGNNVSSFDMTVQIFDLDRLIEYRKTELRGSTKDQLVCIDPTLVIKMIDVSAALVTVSNHRKGTKLFSFDGLTKSTWFAFRIHYKLYYEKGSVEKPDGHLKTKQELIVRTKDSKGADPTKINDTVAYIDDLFLTKDNVYIGVASVFKDTKKVSTIIVPEMRCTKGVLKPVTQQVIHHASFHFDLTILGDSNKSCSKICVYPYVRVIIQNNTSETFRAKEWCGDVEEAKRLRLQSKMRAFFVAGLIASAFAVSVPIASEVAGGIPIVRPILGGSGGSSDLLNNIPIVGNLLNSVGGVLGQLLNDILVNVGIILNAVLNIADEALGAVNVIVNGLLSGLLDNPTVQQLLSILPAPVQALVQNLVQAVQCILNDLQAAVPAVQKAVIQLIGLLVSPAFALLDADSQLAAVFNIIGNLSQDEITVVSTILQRLTDALNNKSCSTGLVTMPTVPSLPGVSLPAIGGGIPSVTTPSSGGLLGLGNIFGGGNGKGLLGIGLLNLKK